MSIVITIFYRRLSIEWTMGHTFGKHIKLTIWHTSIAKSNVRKTWKFLILKSCKINVFPVHFCCLVTGHRKKMNEIVVCVSGGEKTKRKKSTHFCRCAFRVLSEFLIGNRIRSKFWTWLDHTDTSIECRLNV